MTPNSVAFFISVKSPDDDLIPLEGNGAAGLAVFIFAAGEERCPQQLKIRIARGQKAAQKVVITGILRISHRQILLRQDRLTVSSRRFAAVLSPALARAASRGRGGV